MQTSEDSNNNVPESQATTDMPSIYRKRCCVFLKSVLKLTTIWQNIMGMYTNVSIIFLTNTILP